MIIPTFTQHKATDKEGAYTRDAQQYNDELNQYLQDNLSNDGFVMPNRTTSDINTIADPTNGNTLPNGTMWYDTDTNQLKVKVNNVVRVVQLV
jgi:hypothetical protein